MEIVMSVEEVLTLINDWELPIEVDAQPTQKEQVTEDTSFTEFLTERWDDDEFEENGRSIFSEALNLD